MKIKVNYIENVIEFKNDIINVFEIENKKYFYRFVHDLYLTSHGEDIEEIICFDEKGDINLKGKIRMLNDFFEFEFDSKKNLTDISKYIVEAMEDENKNKILDSYKKLIQIVNKGINKIDLPLFISIDGSIESIIKLLKISIESKKDLLENILLIIELEKILKANNLLIFVNLKQYLNLDEIQEFYKYSIYNEVKILMIDSQSYGVTQKYEHKIIIDDSLDEFVL